MNIVYVKDVVYYVVNLKIYWLVIVELVCLKLKRIKLFE